MIFQHTLKPVLNQQKTQTRRVIKGNEVAVRGPHNKIIAVKSNNRTKWRVGRTYAVQPGRGKPQVARIQLTAIAREPIAEISEADAIAEGFISRAEFLQAWQTIHGTRSLELTVWVLSFQLVTPH